MKNTLKLIVNMQSLRHCHAVAIAVFMMFLIALPSVNAGDLSVNSFLQIGQTFYEKPGMSLPNYTGTRVTLTVKQVNAEFPNWVLMMRKFGQNEELIWVNLDRLDFLVVAETK